MFCDAFAVTESKRHLKAFTVYNTAISEEVKKYSQGAKSFCLGYSILGHIGREKTGKPIVFKISKDFLIKACHPNMKCESADIVKNHHFDFEKTPTFDKGIDPVTLEYTREVFERLAEYLSAKPYLGMEFSFEELGRLSFPADRKSWSWVARDWEVAHYVCFRDLNDPFAESEAEDEDGNKFSPRLEVHGMGDERENNYNSRKNFNKDSDDD